MSKRSRSERRQGQLERALRAGDLDTLQLSTGATPEKVATVLLQMVANGHADAPTDAFVEQVLSTAGQLRALHRFERARELIGSIKCDKPRWRIEAALAAIGTGNDAEFEQILRTDPNLAKTFAPCLAILRGDTVAKTPPKVSQLVRGLYGLCRAIRAITESKLPQMRSNFAAIPKTHAAALRTEAWRELATLLTSQSTDSATRAAMSLATSEPVVNHQAMKSALGWELGQRRPNALRKGHHSELYGVDPIVINSAQLSSLTSIHDPVARLRQYLEHGDLQHLSESERAVAHLYQGYFVLAQEPSKALDAFESALALGADLGEVLRGRWMAYQAPLSSRICLGDSQRKHADQAAGRLAHLLERLPDGDAMRIVLLVHIGTQQIHDSELEQLDKTFQVLRTFAQEKGFEDPWLDNVLQIFEAFLIRDSNPAHALELVEPLLTENCREPALWRLGIALLRGANRHADAETVLEKAAAYAISSEFEHEAQRLKRQRRISNDPDQGLTAGVLANEFRDRIDEAGPQLRLDGVLRLIQSSEISTARHRLSSEARAAFDAAAICVVADLAESEQVVVELGCHLMVVTHQEQGRLDWIAAVATFSIQDERVLCEFAGRLAELPIPDDTIERIAVLVVTGASRSVARQFMLRVKGRLGKAATARIERAIYRQILPPQTLHMDDVMATVATLLMPEFDLHEVALFDDGEDDEEDELDWSFDEDVPFVPGQPRNRSPLMPSVPIPPAMVRFMLRQLGLPGGKIDRLADGDLRCLAQLVVQSVKAPGDIAVFAPMVQELLRLGFSPRDIDKALNSKSSIGKARRGKGGFDSCPF